MFKIDRQKVVLFIAKWISYLLNAVIMLALLGVAAWWIYQLYLSTLPTHYHH